MRIKKIKISEPSIGQKEREYVNKALDSGWISGIGPMINNFEREFADFVGVKYALAVSSGTTALNLALLGLGIGPGDDVIVPTLTFAASVNTIIHSGAKPVFVDSSYEDWNIDVNKIESLITNKTKAIIAVHIYGIPIKMNKILSIAKRHGLYVIEDAAEAHGALYAGKMVGSLGDIGCFSFYANKIITTGEGGMCVTNNKSLYEKMKIIYSHGSKAHKSIYYFHPVIGHNFRMTNLQAAVGLAQLSKIESFIRTRAKHEKIYREYLKNVPGIKFSPKPVNTSPVDWMHSILIDHPKISRDEVMRELKKLNIETRPFFYPIHKMPPYVKYERGRSKFAVADFLSNKGINLPSSVNLKKSEIIFVANSIKNIIKNKIGKNAE